MRVAFSHIGRPRALARYALLIWLLQLALAGRILGQSASESSWLDSSQHAELDNSENGDVRLTTLLLAPAKGDNSDSSAGELPPPSDPAKSVPPAADGGN